MLCCYSCSSCLSLALHLEVPQNVDDAESRVCAVLFVVVLDRKSESVAMILSLEHEDVVVLKGGGIVQVEILIVCCGWKS